MAKKTTEIICKEEHHLHTSPDVSLKIESEDKSTNSRKCCQSIQLPITVILIEIALGICCILEWKIWNTPEGRVKYKNVKSNAFGAAWFNGGGVLLHYLPNAMWAFFTGWFIEWTVGSLNMAFVWFWGYFFAVGFAAARNGGFLTGGGVTGFSVQQYHWFTVAGGAVFLRFWLFSNNRNKKLTGKHILWWIGGIVIMLCGGWLGNGGILCLIYLASIIVGYDPDGVAHYVHNVSTLHGYAGVVFLGLLLWWQSSFCGINQNISSEFHSIKIVWISGMYCTKSNKNLMAFTTAGLTIAVLSTNFTFLYLRFS